ncbi:hypothetical protein IW261DRAFT_1572332 [Armillaria novae-zelandiae]|uniref:Uncharacterized protein n=1 Tax=Armillaria novae-zelandiae TaxID=153914 RepID=A0AA39NSL6_9AGAR|nr:hypothetical protein IW261DRAFT_1572332 [Armillaria novae-zelandiae]
MPWANTDEGFALFSNREFGLHKMIEVLHNGAKDYRCDTTSKVHHAVLTLSLKDWCVDRLSLPVPTVKSSQGFNHIDTGCLLCPQIHLEDFNKDPNEILQQLADGDIQPTTSKWPSFMYDQDLYDKNNMFSGLIEIFDDPNGCADTLDAQKGVHPPDSTVSQMQAIFVERHCAKEEAAAATEGFEYLEDEDEGPLMTPKPKEETGIALSVQQNNGQQKRGKKKWKKHPRGEWWNCGADKGKSTGPSGPANVVEEYDDDSVWATIDVLSMPVSLVLQPGVGMIFDVRSLLHDLWDDVPTLELVSASEESNADSLPGLLAYSDDKDDGSKLDGFFDSNSECSDLPDLESVSDSEDEMDDNEEFNVDEEEACAMVNISHLFEIDQARYVLSFGGGQCQVVDPDGNQISSIAHAGKGLYSVIHDDVNGTANAALPTIVTEDELHRRIGHLSLSAPKCLLSQGFITGLQLESTSSGKHFFCKSCVYMKTKYQSVPTV